MAVVKIAHRGNNPRHLQVVHFVQRNMRSIVVVSEEQRHIIRHHTARIHRGCLPIIFNSVKSLPPLKYFLPQQCMSSEKDISGCLLRCNDVELCKSKTCCGLQELGADSLSSGLLRRRNTTESSNSGYVGTPAVVQKKHMLASTCTNGQIVISVSSFNVEDINDGAINNVHDAFIPSVHSDSVNVSYC